MRSGLVVAALFGAHATLRACSGLLLTAATEPGTHGGPREFPFDEALLPLVVELTKLLLSVGALLVTEGPRATASSCRCSQRRRRADLAPQVAWGARLPASAMRGAVAPAVLYAATNNIGWVLTRCAAGSRPPLEHGPQCAAVQASAACRGACARRAQDAGDGLFHLGLTRCAAVGGADCGAAHPVVLGAGVAAPLRWGVGRREFRCAGAGKRGTGAGAGAQRTDVLRERTRGGAGTAALAAAGVDPPPKHAASAAPGWGAACTAR